MKRALVTGGSGVIGAAICRKLAQDGMHVYVHAHSGIARAEVIAAAIRADGGAASAIAFDVCDGDKAGRSARRNSCSRGRSRC